MIKAAIKPFAFFWILITLFSCQSQNEEERFVVNPSVTIHTNQGDIQVELFANEAPATVENFLRYVDGKHYNKTIIHRVIDGFVVQGGGYTVDMQEKQTHPPVKNEAYNGLCNRRGTIAMARTSEIHSAAAQFFINVVDNEFLDHRDSSLGGYGYCVFGRVTKGMDVIDKIKSVKTGSKKGHQDVPLKIIEIIEIVKN